MDPSITCTSMPERNERPHGAVGPTPGHRIVRFQYTPETIVTQVTEVAMNGYGSSPFLLSLALSTAISVGCTTSRGSGCSDGSCRVSPGRGAVQLPRIGKGKAPTDEDARRAQLQKLCPVTGEKLGSMGAPIPVTVKGKRIHVCCESCVATAQSDPEKYLNIVEDEIAITLAAAVRKETSSDRSTEARRASPSSASSRSCH